MPLGDGKFAPTAIAGVTVGYDSEHKGHRICHPPSRKVFVSTQVKFDESIFPLKGSNQTIDSHEFATVYPSAKTKKDRKYQSLFQIAVFPPLAMCPEA